MIGPVCVCVSSPPTTTHVLALHASATVPFLKHSRLSPQGLCTSCSFCLQCSSPSCSEGWFLLVIHALMSSSQRRFPDDTTQEAPPPSHTPSHLCFTFFFTLNRSRYFLVHLFCCGGYCFCYLSSPHLP